jgi:hypothetical protein
VLLFGSIKCVRMKLRVLIISRVKTSVGVLFGLLVEKDVEIKFEKCASRTEV